MAVAWEAERVKLLASAGSEGTFTFQSRAYGTLDIDGLSDLLAEHGLYAEIDGQLAATRGRAARRRTGSPPATCDEVILEGGSTLLPGVRDLIAELFGREKVREWLPFESVARGACIYAAARAGRRLHLPRLRAPGETGRR